MFGNTEARLRDHIHNILSNYSRMHLSTNYITWTDDAVEELLTGSLILVSSIDFTDPLLPTDPFDSLMRSWDVASIPYLNEAWSTEEGAVQHLREIVKSLKPKLSERPSVTCWKDETDVGFESWCLRRPVSPILTTCAIRRTPVLGGQTYVKKLPGCTRDILKIHELQSAPEEVEAQDFTTNLHEAMDLKLPIDASMHTQVSRLSQSVIALYRPVATPCPEARYHEFLRADSPLAELVRLDSPPLFPKDRHPGRQSSSDVVLRECVSTLSSLSDLPSLIPEVDLREEDEEEELYREHMIVVDGWHAFTCPSSPPSDKTPSLGNSSSEVDELFLPSPPDNHKPLVQALMSAKMNDYELPRSVMPHHAYPTPRALGEGQSFHSFLSPLLAGVQQAEVNTATSPKTHPSSPVTLIGESISGQPPSDVGGAGVIPSASSYVLDATSSDWDLDTIMEKVCGKLLGDEEFEDFILREKLDERYCLLMDSESLDGNTLVKKGYFRKVKGLQLLNLELSWRPFKYGPTIPTDEELVGLGESLPSVLAQDLCINDAVFASKTSDLLKGIEHSHVDAKGMSLEPSLRHHCYDFLPPIDFPKSAFNDDGQDMVWTREDRRRMLGFSTYDEEVICSGDEGNEELDGCQSDTFILSTGRSFKRARHGITENNDIDRGVELSSTEDSGVYMNSPQMDLQRRTSNFTQLAFGSEGFEGPNEDGDLFYDIDPMHQLDFMSNSPDRWSHHRTMQADNLPHHDDFRDGCECLPWTDRNPDDTDAVLAYPVYSSLLQGGSGQPEVIMAQSMLLRESPVDSESSKGDASANGPASQDMPLSQRTSVVTSGRQAPSGQKAAQLLDDFLRLVGQKSSSASTSLTYQTTPPSPHCIFPALVNVEQAAPVLPSFVPLELPDELRDANTLQILDLVASPHRVHRYMASLDVIQKRILVRFLSSETCSVDLIERDYLGGVHLILDADVAVLFVPLASFPSQPDHLTTTLCQASRQFTYVLVIFEAYPESLSYKIDAGPPRPQPYPFSPAVIKAVKKLRRDLGIAEAFQTKDAAAVIQFAFATSVQEAALLTRYFGDLAEARDNSGGILWGKRQWLGIDEQEGECDLAAVDGMNHFTASVVLSQMSLDDFLDETPEERTQNFAVLIGPNRIMRFNKELARRAKAARI
ncbi:uncharacterized protein FIBRA_05941 [Fibroporia radiculosa]|uniref:Uncharacterized protein n=1 Tax=Fibroporia radiculosa TaxID=599839 RepID=J4GAD8_9APHY|nr:uncharacterized protein FIBRA_05941 [Fibroporia radiculosa]CCM03793.1 predicted protein [Fibroporia radiculosa]